MDGMVNVYDNLAGKIVEEAQQVVEAIKEQGVKHLIWISTLRICNEVPGAYGQWNHEQLDGGYLETYAEAAEIIEASDLDYTIIRPVWLSDKNEIDYELTKKNESFRGTEVSRKSVLDLVTLLINEPKDYVRESIGVNKPNTNGDKSEWYR